jgi:ATP-dependent Clp protease protease subunit
MKKSFTQIYVDHTSAGKSFEELAKDMERDFFMSANEAVAYGLADSVLQKRNI